MENGEFSRDFRLKDMFSPTEYVRKMEIALSFECAITSFSQIQIFFEYIIVFLKLGS